MEEISGETLMLLIIDLKSHIYAQIIFAHFSVYLYTLNQSPFLLLKQI